MSSAADHPPFGVRPLPRGRHGLPRAFVVENQRERIFYSLAVVCVARSYGDVTVRDIIEHAGVSRRTFYDLFHDKEACFIAAYDAVIARLLRAVSAAYSEGERPWAKRIATAVQAVIEQFVAEPERARLVIVEVLAAGRIALEHRDAALGRFATFFEPGQASLPGEMAGKETLTQAVIGGLYEALYTAIVEDQTDQLPALVPDLLYCVLVPYLGHGAAIAASRTARTRPNGAQ
jgi:AcrR family transcriptional regulator